MTDTQATSTLLLQPANSGGTSTEDLQAASRNRFEEGLHEPSAPLDLELRVTDPEVCTQLRRRPEGRTRHDFAVGALRIGILAIEQARGRVDAEAVRNEGDRLIEKLRLALDSHSRQTSDRLGTTLKEYFDPTSGRFNERVDRLVRRDGELEEVLRRQVGLEGSQLAKTLAEHVGRQSALMQFLDPEQANGLLGAISRSVEGTLEVQSEAILSEFSLDNKDGALCRLLGELAERHGEVTEALQNRIQEVISEFSLDREDSALSRLVGRVEQAQNRISKEFSLDQEGSALARMRRELLEVLAAQQKNNSQFQMQVMERLADMVVRREEEARSPRHGHTFEEAVFGVVQDRCQKAGDIPSRVGSTVGRIRNCKKGDILVELGADSAGAGEKVVLEAKEDASYTLARALSELEAARKNRDAGVGVFVFSARTAPAGLEVLVRNGDDICVVWDADDARSDVVLLAALQTARALCVRSRALRRAEAKDIQTIEVAVLEIQRQARGFEEILRSAETIKSGSTKILERARIMQEAIGRALDTLDEKLISLKPSSLGEDRA